MTGQAGYSLMSLSIALSLATFYTGCSRGILGPTLPDLACLNQVGVEDLSYIVLSQSLASLLVQLMVPKFIQILSNYQLLAGAAFLLSLFFLGLSFAGNIYIVYALAAMAGGSFLLSDSVVFMEVSKRWPEDPRVYFCVLASSAFGSMISPLVLSPFLSDGFVTLNLPTYRQDYQPKNSSGTVSLNCNSFHTLIAIPYTIFGMIGIFVVVMFVHLHYAGVHSETMKEEQDTEEYLSLGEGNDTDQGALHYVFLVIMFCFILDGQMHSAFGTLLPLFGIQRLNMKVEDMALMTSLFWVAFLIGRVIPCFLPRTVKKLHIIIAYNIGFFVGYVLLVFALDNATYLWLSSIIIGLCSAPRMPATFNWTKSLLPDTPYIVMLKFMSLSVSLSFSYVSSELMARISVDTFVYFHIGIYLFNLTMLLCMILVCRWQQKDVCV